MLLLSAKLSGISTMQDRRRRRIRMKTPPTCKVFLQ